LSISERRGELAIIICQNCGTTNNEFETRICRTCGALLPISTKPPRMRIPKADKGKKKIKDKSNKQNHQKKQEEISSLQAPEKLELQEIPKDLEENVNNVSSIQFHVEEQQEESKGLQEITPQPFKGLIIEPPKPLDYHPPTKNNIISDAFTELKQSVLEVKKEEQKPPLDSISSEKTKFEMNVVKQKRLEKDMAEVLGFLSKKISVKKLEKTKKQSTVEKDFEEKIPPASMSEILSQLITLDPNIEASAIIKTDGTILASAISNRISDSLFTTIGVNLSMIGNDIIDGLNAGTLKYISLRGSDGVLDLAPIDKKVPELKDMVLLLFSHPKVKGGIISFAVHIVKKEIKEYLGLEKE